MSPLSSTAAGFRISVLVHQNPGVGAHLIDDEARGSGHEVQGSGTGAQCSDAGLLKYDIGLLKSVIAAIGSEFISYGHDCMYLPAILQTRNSLVQ